MKTYKYSKFSFFIQFFLVIVLIVLLLCFEYKFNRSRFFSRATFLAIFLIACIPFVVSVYRRKIILDKEHLDFISVFNSFYTSKEERNFSVRYGDITNIEVKKSIIPKKISLKLKVKNRLKPMYIEYNMVNHKELFRNLCEKVQKANPDAYIESRIWRYLQT